MIIQLTFIGILCGLLQLLFGGFYMFFDSFKYDDVNFFISSVCLADIVPIERHHGCSLPCKFDGAKPKTTSLHLFCLKTWKVVYHHLLINLKTALLTAYFSFKARRLYFRAQLLPNNNLQLHSAILQWLSCYQKVNFTFTITLQLDEEFILHIRWIKCKYFVKKTKCLSKWK